MSGARPLNVAVVGAGFARSIDGRENWGVRTHLPALRSLPQHFNLVAVCTSRMASARETAEHFGVPHAFDDYRALMRMDGLDVVTVVVRPKLHFPVVMAALEAGKHVYCEWPLALDTGEARQMAELARTKGVLTATGTQGHYWPAAEKMRALVKAGWIGRPLLFGASSFVSNYIAPRPAHRQWLFQASEGGQAAYRSGHLLERVTSMLGDVRSVSADLSMLVPSRPRLGEAGSLEGDQVDNINLLLELEGGVRGTLQVSFTSWFGTGQRFEVYGTQGMLLLSRQGPDASGTSGATGHNDPGYLEAGELFGAQVDTDALLQANRPPESLLHQMQRIPVDAPRDVDRSGLEPYGSAWVVRRAFESFAESIRRGVPFEPDFAAGARLHRVLEAAEVSARDGRRVAVEPE